MDLRSYIRDIPDYPKEGILFFDITPLLENGEAFACSIDRLAECFAGEKIDKVVAAEARGFIFGAPLAYKLKAGFVPVRKPGKLPYETASVSYDLEYGQDTLQMHVDAIKEGERVLIIDDLLATGGTIGGVIKLVENAKADIVGVGFLTELSFLDGHTKMNGHRYESLFKL